MTSPATLAERLRAAATAGPGAVSGVLAESYGAEIDLRHVPARASDGPMKSSRLIAIGKAENEALSRAMPDYHFKRFDVTAEGDRVVLDMVQAGTLPDGRAVASSVRVVLTIADGAAVRMEAHRDREAAQPLFEAYRLGGLELPA